MRVADVFAALRLDTSEFQKGLQGLNGQINEGARGWTRSMAKFQRSTASLGRSMTTNLTLPIIGAGAAVSKLAFDFDKTLTQVVALTSVTQDQIAGIREELLKLGPEVGKSPRELAEAFYFVASAGFEGAEALEVIKVAAQAAAAGLGDTSTVAKVVGTAINAYGRENITAAEATDTLVAAIGEGSAEAPEFAGALGNVIGSAAQIGASFGDVTAAIAAMTNVGIGAEESVTSLNQVFVSLFKPTNEAAEALSGMGLSAASLRTMIAERGLLPTLTLLADKFEGNAEATATVFGNVRALRGVLALTGGDVEKTAGIFGRLTDTTAATGEAFSTVAESDAFKLQQSMAELEAVAIELGTDVLPTVVDIARDVADAARGVASAWRGLSDETQQSIIQWALWLAIAGPVLTIVSKVAGALVFLGKTAVFLTGAKGIPRLIGVLRGLRAATWLAVPGLGAFAVAAALLHEPISDLINDLSGITKGMQELSRKVGVPASHVKRELEDLARDLGISLGLARDRVEDFMETTGASFNDAVDAVRNNEDELRANLETWNQLYEDGLSGVTTTIDAGNRDAADAMGDLPPALAASLVDGEFVVETAAEEMVDPIEEAIQKAQEDAAREAQGIIDALASVLATGPDQIQDEVDALRDALINPYIEVERRADLETSLAMNTIARNLKSGDARSEALAFEQVMNWLEQYELLAPGALAAGKLVNPALQDGINANLAAALAWVQENVTGEYTNLFDLADVLDELGFENLAGYARGVQRGQWMASRASMQAKQAVIRELVAGENEAFHSGFRSGTIYGQGVGTPSNVRGAGTAGRHLAFAARDGANFSLYGIGQAVAASFAEGLWPGGQSFITDATGQIRRSVGGHLQFAGSPPYTKSREYGAGVAQSWIGALLDEFRQGIPALVSRMASFEGALQPAFAGALSSLSFPSMTAAVAAPNPGPGTSIEYNYNLNVNGVQHRFKNREDFLRALEDMAAFGDGRVPG